MDGDHPNLCDLSDCNMMSRNKQSLPNNINRETSAVASPVYLFPLRYGDIVLLAFCLYVPFAS